MKIGAIFGLVGSIFMIVQSMISALILMNIIETTTYVTATSFYEFCMYLGIYFLNPAAAICFLIFFISLIKYEKST